MLDVRAAGIEHLDFARIGVKTSDLMTGFGKAQGQRQANVAAADDSDFQMSAFEEFGFPLNGHGFTHTPCKLTPSRAKSGRISIPGYACFAPVPHTGSQKIGRTRQRQGKYNSFREKQKSSVPVIPQL